MTHDRDRRQAAEPEARRRLTILFTDLSDSTRLSGAMEAEIYAGMLDEVRQAFTDVVNELGGTVNQFQGDGLQALFGHSEEAPNFSGLALVDGFVKRFETDLSPR